MSIIEIGKTITLFIEMHHLLGWIVILLLSFAESLVVVSLFFPATIILVTFSSALGQSNLSFPLFWLAAVCGAFLGDAVSYWLGYHFEHRLFKWRFLAKQQALQQKGTRFFIRWGIWSVLVGRFFGPFRAIMPFIAGMCRMNILLFQLANLLSAMLWGFMVLAPGVLGLPWLQSLI